MCGMGNGNNCYKIIDTWTVGSVGSCYPEQMGIKMNKKDGYDYFVMQVIPIRIVTFLQINVIVDYVSSIFSSTGTIRKRKAE